MIKSYVIKNKLAAMWLAGAVCLASIAPVAAKRPLTVDDLMAVRNVGDVQISPDGQRVAYVVHEADFANNAYASDVYLVSVEGGEPTRFIRNLKLTPASGSPRYRANLRWSPDGRRLAFLSGREGAIQVYVMNVGGGEAERVTNSKTPVLGFEWSPDSAKIAYTALDPPSEEEVRRQSEKEDVLIVGANAKMVRLWLCDLATGEATQLTRGDYSVEGFSWSPDNRHIAFAVQATPDYINRWSTKIAVISVQGGEPRYVVDRPGTNNEPRWSPDGQTIAFLSAGGRSDFLGNINIHLVPASGGPVQALPFDEWIREYWWAADGRSLYFMTDIGFSTGLFSVSATSAEVRRLTPEDKVCNWFSFSRDNSRLACLLQDGAHLPDVYVSPVVPFEPKRLTNINPQFTDFALGSMEPIQWGSTDGFQIEGLLVKPVGYEVGRRYPLLVYVHGGPIGNFHFSIFPQFGDHVIPTQAEPYPVQVFANLGYAVLLPHPRGSAGYGDRFRRANVKDWGGGDYRDIMAGVDYLIERGVADPQRLGVMGASYGGYMTSWIITQTGRFQAASTGASVTNLYSFYGQTDVSDVLDDYFGGPPWAAKQEYDQHSPMSFADRIRTPTLIQHGERDQRVPLAQAQELYRAIKKNGTPVEFAIYPRAGHVVLEPKLQREQMQRNIEWFTRWILPRPEKK